MVLKVSERSLEALEFPAVLALVAELASSDAGRDVVHALRPLDWNDEEGPVPVCQRDAFALLAPALGARCNLPPGEWATALVEQDAAQGG